MTEMDADRCFGGLNPPIGYNNFIHVIYFKDLLNPFYSI